MQKQFPHKQRVKHWKTREQNFCVFQITKQITNFSSMFPAKSLDTHLPLTGTADANCFPLENKIPSWRYQRENFCKECILLFRRLIFFEICPSEHCRHFLKSSLSYNLNGSYMTAYINALSCESALRLCLISKNSGGSCLKHASTK